MSCGSGMLLVVCSIRQQLHNYTELQSDELTAGGLDLLHSSFEFSPRYTDINNNPCTDSFHGLKVDLIINAHLKQYLLN